MKPERRAFLHQHLLETVGLTESNATVFMDIFDAEAARAVRSTPFSSSGIFPSYKNRAAIESESRTGELPYDRLLEHDGEVLAYAHQPQFPVKVWWLDKSGQKRTATLTPDRAVVRRDRAVLVEVKSEEALVTLANDRPGYVLRDPDTQRWRCQSAEAYLAQFGLEYELVTPALYPHTRIRNLENLGAAFRSPLPAPAAVMAIVDRVRASPGIMLDQLVAEARVALGEALVLVAAGIVFGDLDRDDLTLPSSFPLYMNRKVSEALASRHTPSFAIGLPHPPALSLRMGSRFHWMGAAVEVVAAGPERVLLRETADADSGSWVPRPALEAGWLSGDLVPEQVPPGIGRTGSALARERYEVSGQDGQDEACRRWDLLKAWKATGIVPSATSRRTLHRWEKERRAMEALTGDPLVGLCPLPPAGNDSVKVDMRVLEIIEAVIKERYLVPNGCAPAAVAAEVARRCLAGSLPMPHDRTVGRRILALPEELVVAAREGRKAAYNLLPWAPINPDSASPNGDFAFSVAHIDGTELDLEVAHSRTGLPLGRPWLHRMVDGHTGAELARFIGFVNPSQAVVLELFWRCAVRWGVLPRRIEGDLGSEHRGGAIRTCALAYGVEIGFRPKSRARHGAPVERSFWSLDTDLLYQLSGNTQSRKNVRQETPEINPTNHAVHSVSWLDGIMDEYNEIIGKRIAPRLGERRAEALRRGLRERAGTVLPFIAVDERLRFLTMAPVEQTTRILHPVKGFTVGRINYWDAALARPDLSRTPRPVRAALGDPTWVLVDIGGGYLRVAERSLARQRVTSPHQIAHVATEFARTGTVAVQANREVRIELAGLATRAHDHAEQRRSEVGGLDQEAERRSGESKAEFIARLREEETAETQAWHSAAGPRITPSNKEPLPADPSTHAPEPYDPYAEAWEDIA